MPSETSHKKRRYSAAYAIYRRIRYICFLRKKKKQILLENRRKESAEKEVAKKKEQERIKYEKRLAKEKQRHEKEQRRILRKEMERNLKQNRLRLIESEKELSRIREEQEIKEKTERKRKQRRMFRFWLRLQVRYWRRTIRSTNADTFKNWYRRFRSKSESRKKLLIIFVNSLTYSMLAYFTLYLFHQLAMLLTASFFHFPATLYYHEIYYHITSDDWTADAIKTIYLAGPLAAFLLGFLFYVVYQQIKELDGAFKVFFIWGSLYAVSFLFGGALIGSLFETGMGHAISWMYVMDTGKVFTSILSLFFLFVAGLAVRRSFFFSANSYFQSLNSHNRRGFLMTQVLLPFLAANLLILIIRMPRFMLYETLVSFTLIISLLPVVINTEDTQDLYFEEEEKKPRIDWRTMVVTLLVILFYRFVLEMGIKLT